MNNLTQDPSLEAIIQDLEEIKLVKESEYDFLGFVFLFLFVGTTNLWSQYFYNNIVMESFNPIFLLLLISIITMGVTWIFVVYAFPKEK